MAPGADGPGEGPDQEPLRLDRILRVLEAVTFCCLSTLILFWVADRLRGVDFEPITVIMCEVTECLPYVGPYSGSPWSAFTTAIDAQGVTSFSNINVCTTLAETLLTRGEQEPGVDQIIELIAARGTATISRPEDGTLIIGPGARNDGFGDVVRDAFRVAPGRGCHPINYKPVFWPLWTAWVLLISLRLFRNRQAVWSTR